MMTILQDAVCETQGEIFRCANESRFDMEKFIPNYMNSEFCKREMDSIYSYFQMADGEECLDFICKEIQPEITETIKYKTNIIEWIGYFYRQLFFSLKINSKEIFQRIPFETMLIYYPGLHTIDEDMAIDIVKNDLSYK